MKPKKPIRASFILAISLVIVLACTPAVYADEKTTPEYGLQIQGVPYHFPPPLPGEEINESMMTGLPESEHALRESIPSRDSYATLHLYEGWNYVSIPLWLEDGYNTYFPAVFGRDNGANVSVICRWDSEHQTYVQAVTGHVIVPLEGFMVKANEEQDVPLHFKEEQYQTVPTRDLYEGANLVGSWGFTGWSAHDTFISVNDAWTQATGYDNELHQSETTIINGGSGIYSDERIIYPKKAYWLWMDNPATLVPLKATKDNHDEDYPQVGVEWVTEYDSSSPLPLSDDNAIGFYNTLGNAGWVQMFEYGNTETDGSHFTAATEDWQYIDGVDIAYYSGHASYHWLDLGPGLLNVVPYTLCEWGDHDLEWIFLHGCHTTALPVDFKSLPHWAMNGVHLVCGYITVGWDTNDGATLATRLLNGETVKDAWFNAIDETHDSNFILRVIGENEACGNDHIWGSGSVISDPPVDGTMYDEWIYYCDDNQ